MSGATCKTCPSCGSPNPYRRGHLHPGLRITHCHAVMGNHQAVTPCDDSWHGTFARPTPTAVKA